MPDTFCVTRADADGLVECLCRALKSIGIENLLERECVLNARELPVVVGCGTDGASVNVSHQNGMRGKLPYLGCTGPGVMRIGLNSHARTPFPVVSSLTSTIRCYGCTMCMKNRLRSAANFPTSLMISRRCSIS